MCDNFEKDNTMLLAAKLERGFSKSEAAHAGGIYICYTDGSCDNLDRRRVGGASYIIIHNDEVFKKVSKSFVGTTNNRMELLAIISAVNACPEGSFVHVVSDSQYALNMLGMRIGHSANSDLFDLFVKCSEHVQGLSLEWVRGHSGNKWNEEADRLAYEAYCAKCKELGIEARESLTFATHQSRRRSP